MPAHDGELEPGMFRRVFTAAHRASRHHHHHGHGRATPLPPLPSLLDAFEPLGRHNAGGLLRPGPDVYPLVAAVGLALALAGVLAARLSAAGQTRAATLCYICAGNIDQTVDYWVKCEQLTDGRTYSVDALHAVIEKAVVLGYATGRKQASEVLSNVIAAYAEQLSAQGQDAAVIVVS